jgi:hypothetical protein
MPPDPVTVGAAALVGREVIKAAAPVVQDFWQRVLGPVADTWGDGLKGAYIDFRRRNLARVVTRAAEIDAGSEATVKPVPARLLIPIVEAASLEANPALQERWAALLARAARGEIESPIFATLLSELGPGEVAILDQLAPVIDTPTGRGRTAALVPFSAIVENLHDYDHVVSMSILMGRGLAVAAEDDGTGYYMPPPTDHGSFRVALDAKRLFRLTALGVALIAACTPPHPAE